MTSKAFLFALFTSVFVQLIGVDNGHDWEIDILSQDGMVIGRVN